MDDRKQRFIQLLAMLHMHLRGADGKDADEQAIIDQTLSAVDKMIADKMPDKAEMVSEVTAKIPIPSDGKDGVDGKDGKQGKQGKVGKSPTKTELLSLIQPLIPEAETVDMDSVRQIIADMMPEAVEETGTVPDSIVVYIQTVVQTLRNNIASKTYDAEEIVGLGDFVDNRTADGGQEWEKISQNLATFPAALTYSGDNISSIDYTTDIGTITKTLNYTGDNVTSIVLSGDLPTDLSETTKTLVYSGSNLSSYSYS